MSGRRARRGEGESLGSQGAPEGATESHKWVTKERRRGPESHGEPRKGAQSHGDARRRTERHKEPRRGMESHRGPRMAKECHRRTWRATENQREPRSRAGVGDSWLAVRESQLGDEWMPRLGESCSALSESGWGG